MKYQKEFLKKKVCTIVLLFIRTLVVKSYRPETIPYIAALAYKLADCAMAEKDSLPANLTCIQIKKQWGLPSLRAEQDPEKERLKRQPLQNITFQRLKYSTEIFLLTENENFQTKR